MSLGTYLKRKLWVNDTLTYEEGNMSCEPMEFIAVDQALYAKLLSLAAAGGIKFDGIRVSFKGCEFSWSYDALSEKLHITCEKKPFYVPCSGVTDHISALIDQARKSDF